MNNHYTELVIFMEKYTEGTQSTLARLWECSKALLVKTVESDISIQFGSITDYQTAADTIFSQSLDVHKRNGHSLETKLEQIIVVTTTSLPGAGGVRAVRSLLEEALVTTSIHISLTNQMRELTGAPKNLSYLYDVSSDHLPETFFADPEACAESISMNIENLNELEIEIGNEINELNGVTELSQRNTQIRETLENRLPLLQSSGIYVCNSYFNFENRIIQKEQKKRMYANSSKGQ